MNASPPRVRYPQPWQSSQEKPENGLIIHSNQASQFGNNKFSRRCKDPQLSPSMSWHSNFCDNAAAESFFIGLKSELIKNTLSRRGPSQIKDP